MNSSSNIRVDDLSQTKYFDALATVFSHSLDLIFFAVDSMVSSPRAIKFRATLYFGLRWCWTPRKRQVQRCNLDLVCNTKSRCLLQSLFVLLNSGRTHLETKINSNVEILTKSTVISTICNWNDFSSDNWTEIIPIVVSTRATDTSRIILMET